MATQAHAVAWANKFRNHKHGGTLINHEVAQDTKNIFSIHARALYAKGGDAGVIDIVVDFTGEGNPRISWNGCIWVLNDETLEWDNLGTSQSTTSHQA